MGILKTAILKVGRTVSPGQVFVGEPRTASPTYRPDLEGVRGVGIILVVLYHATGAFPPGAFIAIDMFFVISGYLITGIIQRAVERGAFSFADFYSRRVRRLFPALLVVLCATIGLGWLFLLPEELRLLGKHAASGAFFYPNFAMQAEREGYFETGAAFRPLLPLWSLGVEEQFYLLWPPVLIVALRRGLNLAIILAVLCAGSFAINLWLSHGHPMAAYYLPFGRAWEILAGAALTLVRRQPGPAVANGASLLGAGLLLIGCVIIPQKGFPGFWALIPVIGTGLIIWAGRNAVANRALASPFLVFVGLISYSVYLWHWPLLTIQSITTGEEWSTLLRLLTALLSFFLGWLTYRFFERPARTRSSPRLVAGLVAGMAAVGAFGFVLAGSDGFPKRYPPEILNAITARSEMIATRGATWREGQCFLDLAEAAGVHADSDRTWFAPECVETGSSETSPLVVVWGDSHAAAFYSGLSGARRDLGVRLAQFTAATCAPVISRGVTGPLTKTQRLCVASNDRTLREVTRLRPDVVVLVGSWSQHERLAPGLSATLAALQDQGIKVVVVGQAPLWWPILPKQVVTRYRADGVWPERLPLDISEARRTDARISAVARRYGATFRSPTDVLCNGQGCLTRAGDPPYVTTFDRGHMTPQGARLLANAFAADLKPVPQAR